MIISKLTALTRRVATGTADASRLLIATAAMRRQISRERVRSSRREIPFCLVRIRLNANDLKKGRVRSLSKLLHRNTRITDDKGWLQDGTLGVLLVDTPQMGGRVVVDRLQTLLADAGYNAHFALDVFDPRGFDNENLNDHDSDDRDSDHRDSPPGQSGMHDTDPDLMDADPTILESDDDTTEIPEISQQPHEEELQPVLAGSTTINASLNAALDTSLNASVSSALVASVPDSIHSTRVAPRKHTSTRRKVASGNRRMDTGHPVPGPRNPRPPRNADQERSPAPVTETRMLRFDGPESVMQDYGLTENAYGVSLIKRTLDIFGATIGLIIASPILLIACVSIRWGSKGPALFMQKREGLNGRPFTIFKLRTMVIDAEEQQARLRRLSERDGPAFKLTDDPRITPLGHFLRASCIDELPQLWNVLLGDMSLVGPRPLPWDESRACMKWHRRRLDVRPGMTCFWQVAKAEAETFDDWMRMDLRYVDRGSLRQDVCLVVKTFTVPLLNRGDE